MRIFLNGTIHKILELLSTQDAEMEDIQKLLAPSLPISKRSTLDVDVLFPMQEEGLILYDTVFAITQVGTAKLRELEEAANTKRAAEEREKVRASQLVARGVYDGAELKLTAVRPGALDYRKHPSIINGSRVSHD